MKELLIRCRGIIINDNKLLVVKHSGGRDFYALPGGHLDYGENPKECIERELIEELGVKPIIGRLLFVYTYTKEERHFVEFFFEIKNGSEYLLHEEKEKSHAYEIEEVLWVDSKSVPCIYPKEIESLFKSGTLMSASETQFISGT